MSWSGHGLGWPRAVLAVGFLAIDMNCNGLAMGWIGRGLGWPQAAMAIGLS
jgi:hypothetical protein